MALSKRSQEAEAAFLNVYKQLIETPGKKCLGSIITELIWRNSHYTGASSWWGMGTGWLLGTFMSSLGGNYRGEGVLCPVWCDIPTWLLHLPPLPSSVNQRIWGAPGKVSPLYFLGSQEACLAPQRTNGTSAFRQQSVLKATSKFPPTWYSESQKFDAEQKPNPKEYVLYCSIYIKPEDKN